MTVTAAREECTRLGMVEGVFRFVPNEEREERAGLARETIFPYLCYYRFLAYSLAIGLWSCRVPCFVLFLYVLYCL